jgi:hypothetical protein
MNKTIVDKAKNPAENQAKTTFQIAPLVPLRQLDSFARFAAKVLYQYRNSENEEDQEEARRARSLRPSPQSCIPSDCDVRLRPRRRVSESVYAHGSWPPQPATAPNELVYRLLFFGAAASNWNLNRYQGVQGLSAFTSLVLLGRAWLQAHLMTWFRNPDWIVGLGH